MGVVEYGAEVAETEAEFFGGDADVLGCEGGIDGAGHEPEEVVVGLVTIAEAAPVVVAVDVDADCDEGGCAGSLSEMELGKCGYVLGFLCDDDAIYLHIACVGGSGSALEYALHCVGVDGGGLEFPDGAMVEDGLFGGEHKG